MPHDLLATLEKLRRYDTPTICNVIELFEIRPRNQGFMDQRIRAAFAELPPMVGFACTAAFRSDQPPGQGDAYGSLQVQLEQFAELPGPAVVVFQDLDEPAVGATFGEVMCSTYQAFGSTGLITSGGGRDLEQVHALKYPVFTGSTICSHASRMSMGASPIECLYWYHCRYLQPVFKRAAGRVYRNSWNNERARSPAMLL